jgi:Fe-S-cluster containining protein
MSKSRIEAILKEYIRMDPESKFRFSCHKGLDCFTRCCADVNIFLTPYDVLRMRKALNLNSGEFIKKYTISPFLSEQKLPLVLLRMRDDARRSCPFVTTEGCSIYEDRPWSCRMFPLEIAPSKTADRPEGHELYLINQESSACLGLEEDREWTVAEWRRDQGIDLYEQKSEPYHEITRHYLVRDKGLHTGQNHIFFITCYDLDRFRRLLLESSFLNRFDIAPEAAEAIRTDDEALLDFGYKWLKFSLLGEAAIKIKDEELARKKKELLKQISKRVAHEKKRKPRLSG